MIKLTALISSLLIYNVSKRVGEDIVAHAAHFSSIAREARPAQLGETHLLSFLVRDWEYFDEDVLGGRGQEEMFEMVETSAASYLASEVMGEKLVSEANQNRQALKEAFNDIGVYLLPHPGREVTRPDFQEHQSERMDPMFRALLVRYCDQVILESERILAASSVLIYGKELHLILTHACAHFRDQSPRLETLFASTARASNVFAAELARKKFDQVFAFTAERFHQSLEAAVEVFDQFARYGPDELKEEFRDSVARHAEAAMERLTQIQMQVKLKRRRMKQIAVATTAGVALAPFWLPSAVGFASRAMVFVASTTASQTSSEMASAGVALTSMLALGVILANFTALPTLILSGSRFLRQSRHEKPD